MVPLNMTIYIVYNIRCLNISSIYIEILCKDMFMFLLIKGEGTENLRDYALDDMCIDCLQSVP